MQGDNLSEVLRVSGTVTIVEYDKNNNVISEIKQKNLILAKGLQKLVGSLSLENGLNINYIAAGIGTPQPTESNTRLAEEISRAEVVSKASNNVDTVIYGAYFGFEKRAGVITEVGLVSDGNERTDSGVFFSRTVLETPIVKTVSNAFSVTWAITFGR